jgi:hypothetical protein
MVILLRSQWCANARRFLVAAAYVLLPARLGLSSIVGDRGIDRKRMVDREDMS